MTLTARSALHRIVGGVLHDTASVDDVVVEAPLEIRVRGVRIAVVMRTPGHDEELARGFLLTERVVDDPAHIHRVEPCSVVDGSVAPEDAENVLDAALDPAVDLDLDRLKRNLYASSSCGVCGKAALESVLAHAPPLDLGYGRTTVSTLLALPDVLRSGQDAFSRTGGLHAAALFDEDGALLVVREDVGRHNAVDKVVGAISRTDARARAVTLQVSGRVSFEIVQKAAAARLPIVAGVSAPSSLAIALADALGITLVGFSRGASANVYTHRQRLRPAG